MIPTTCPHGKDPRMCAYCDKKDTCGCRCDKNTDVLWGEITGELKDQTDLQAALDKHTADILAVATLANNNKQRLDDMEETVDEALSSMTAANSIPAILKIMDDNLYVVSPKGVIKDTDEPVFARYVKSRVRQKTGDTTIHRKRSGWIVPTRNTEKCKQTLVPLKMEKVERWDSNVYDYYRILAAATTYDAQPSERDYKADLGLEFYNATSGLDFEKRLGIAINRKGVQITDWLPFTVTGKKEKYKDKKYERYYLSRPNVGYKK